MLLANRRYTQEAIETAEQVANLAQGRAFSIYDGLQHSNAFVEKHKPYWFAQVQMPGTSLKDIQARMPGRLTLSM
ncbi:hypothetical protein D8T51_18385 [Vibrio vulnificus]|uniref:hypothetical protein n=1 Tax=Vibrio vulnificus TaxID=672 RepID=UPI001028EBD0|nr:hypothetical protein [Vibrio vulnificus]RZP72732.1 hypothetical protein D8T52_19940 [Vibrio vulnificus]RZP73605.1 hypothetical protein D8T51_18385 [Vibrio vulnificus]